MMTMHKEISKSEVSKWHFEWGIDMRAKDYLNQISKIDRLIENKIAEMDQWKAIATGTTSYSEGDRVQSSGSKEKMADAVARYLDMENEINSEIDRLIDIKQEVISTIEQLQTDEYDILHKIYVQFKSFQEVAAEKGKSYSWVTSKHGRGLANLQRILEVRKK